MGPSVVQDLQSFAGKHPEGWTARHIPATLLSCPYPSGTVVPCPVLYAFFTVNLEFLSYRTKSEGTHLAGRLPLSLHFRAREAEAQGGGCVPPGHLETSAAGLRPAQSGWAAADTSLR